ncbi:MAG: C45 family autoproteolytic acyltransferase/hydrolase [Planctomycetota bacterium]|jgi:predicted choloylglycine hydrolase
MIREKLAFLAALVLFSPGFAQTPGLGFREKAVAGGPADFIEVRHITLRGSNFEIGKKLAEIGRFRHGTGPIPGYSRRQTQAQLRYLRRYYPIHVERMRGVAAAFGTDLDNHAFNFGQLFYGLGSVGCSVVFYPPGTTADGRGVLSRNFDFTTGTLHGTRPPEAKMAASSRPYIIEMYPDKGYASLSLCLFDLLGGVVGGVNSEGLVVALLGDDEVVKAFPIDGAPGPQAGLTTTQALRFLLDTCADVEQAKAALLETKLYYLLVPCHYIIADRHGNSFVWENSPVMHHGHIIAGNGKPQVTTNFLLHRQADLDNLPEEEHRLGSYNRYKTLRKHLSEHEGKFDLAFIKEVNHSVACTESPPAAPYAANRTIWHALYLPQQRRLEIDFYLGEDVDPTATNGVKLRRSGYQAFTLVD